MSVLILELDSDTLKGLYGGGTYVMRCYKNKVKFFEMPMSKIFLPIY